MSTNTKARKWQLTINNPKELNLEHEAIKFCLSKFNNVLYYCMCDEIGEQGTYHTHIYFVLKNACCFNTIQNRFKGAHIEKADGTSLQNKEYITKTGKWENDNKKETNIKDTFEEFGELPDEHQGELKVSGQVVEMINNGASDLEIINKFPSTYNKLPHIQNVRQSILQEEYKNTFRVLDVTYLWGETGTGKTRAVMETYGYENVYRVTDYKHPFDGYKNQEVIAFEEFRSSLYIADMLKYLDGYPLELPCRYANKTACFQVIFIISNIPLKEQYTYEQEAEPETWNAFLRRINREVNL